MEANEQILVKQNRTIGLMEVVHSAKPGEHANPESELIQLENVLTKKERAGLKIICNHKGKRNAFDFYRRHNSEMAIMYLKFVSKYTWAQYIIWDNINKRFVI